MIPARTLQTVLFFSNKGKVYSEKAYQIPDASRTARGYPIVNVLALSPGELYDRNFSYAAGRCPARHYMPASLDLALREQEKISTMVSHRLPLSEGVEAYRRFAAREPGWNKVVLLP